MSLYSETMVYIATAGFLASILVMLALSPFYRTATGRVLFSVKVATFFVLFLIASRNAYGEYNWIETARMLIYTAAAAAGWGVTIVILRAQLKNRKSSKVEKSLWVKHVPEEDKDWDGVDRRRPEEDREPTA